MLHHYGNLPLRLWASRPLVFTLAAGHVITSGYVIITSSRLWAAQVDRCFPPLAAGDVMADTEAQHHSHEESDVVGHHGLHQAHDYVMICDTLETSGSPQPYTCTPSENNSSEVKV